MSPPAWLPSDPEGSGQLSFAEVVGQPSSAALQLIGFPSPQVGTRSVLPAGLSLASSGTITGTPAAGSGGVYDAAVTASDSLGASVANVAIVVDQPPAITSPTSYQASYGSNATIQITEAEGTYPMASFSLDGAVPAGMSFRDNADGTATISGTSDNYVSGMKSFSVIASSSAGSVNVPMSIDVAGTPPLPVTSLAVSPSPSTGSSTVVIVEPSTGPSTGPATAPASSSGPALAPMAVELAGIRAHSLASRGVVPAVTSRASLPATDDPLAGTVSVHRGKRIVRVAQVRLGRVAGYPTLGNLGPY